MASPEAAIEFLKFNCSQAKGNKYLQFDSLALHGMYGFSAGDGTATCYLDVTEEFQNRYGTLHGGCIATLVDVVGTAAQLTKINKSGVSLNISVNYMRPGQGGSTVKVQGEVVKIGKTVSSIEVTITEKETGRMVAKGTHVKARREMLDGYLACGLHETATPAGHLHEAAHLQIHHPLDDTHAHAVHPMQHVSDAEPAFPQLHRVAEELIARRDAARKRQKSKL